VFALSKLRRKQITAKPSAPLQMLASIASRFMPKPNGKFSKWSVRLRLAREPGTDHLPAPRSVPVTRICSFERCADSHDIRGLPPAPAHVTRIAAASSAVPRTLRHSLRSISRKLEREF